MQTLSDVRMLHVELSSRCNARCPLCRRNFRGFPFNGGYEEVDLSLEKLKTIASPEFLKHIEEFWICGNFGDFVMNHESVPIIQYVLASNPDCQVKVSTNGSARDQDFWEALGKLNIEIWFCLDGLGDTHHLYRQDTNFDTILRNAGYFMAAGGKAVWSFTEFEYNTEQIPEIYRLAKELGFDRVEHRRNMRLGGPVYNRQGQKIFWTGKKHRAEFPETVSQEWLESLVPPEPADIGVTKVKCEALNNRSLYIGATGAITPCCYMDFPRPNHKDGRHPNRDQYQNWLLEDAPNTLSDNTSYFPRIVESLTNKIHYRCQYSCKDHS